MKFYKYHGCGNDFLITDKLLNVDYSELAKKICNRHTGIGADGLIVVPDYLYHFIIYNADGSLAEMCGNGIRCFARYLYEVKHVLDKKYLVRTHNDLKEIEVLDFDNFKVRVNMGKPATETELSYIFYDTTKYDVYHLNFGVPHAIVYVDHFNFNLEKVGKYICEHPIFLNKTNVNFVKVVDPRHLIVKTYERGCGLTLACGTGSSAAVLVGYNLFLNEANCEVILEEGTLNINFEGDEVFMEGPATFIATIDNFEVEDEIFKI